MRRSENGGKAAFCSKCDPDEQLVRRDRPRYISGFPAALTRGPGFRCPGNPSLTSLRGFPAPIDVDVDPSSRSVTTLLELPFEVLAK
jgi:hypothetical protein